MADIDPFPGDAFGALVRRMPRYGRLALALGSRLVRPELPGFGEFAFDVDTYEGAKRLREHLGRLAAEATSPKDGETAKRVLVVGAGLTGIELAAELAPQWRVTLADHGDHIGSDMGPYARPVIAEALAALGVETRVGVGVTALSEEGATLSTGEVIPAATIAEAASKVVAAGGRSARGR